MKNLIFVLLTMTGLIAQSQVQNKDYCGVNYKEVLFKMIDLTSPYDLGNHSTTDSLDKISHYTISELEVWERDLLVLLNVQLSRCGKGAMDFPWNYATISKYGTSYATVGRLANAFKAKLEIPEPYFPSSAEVLNQK